MKDENFHQNRARKRLIIFAIIIVIAGGVFWYFVHSDSFEKISALENSAQNFAATKIATTFSAPPPLIASSSKVNGIGGSGVGSGNAGGEGSSGVNGVGLNGSGAGGSGAVGTNALTRAGVIMDTNEQRSLNGNLPPLAENQTLDDIASFRLDDMFAKQYFAHVSPSSSSAETVAKAVGYSYIALGENLALGNFGSDAGVVTAWMNSPGHRANILDTHYTQIGVAVGEGEFQGQEAWIAVQVFGRPASDCPNPNADLKAEIDSEQSQVTQMQVQIQNLQTEISAANPQSGGTYNQEVTEYNALVNQYDSLLAQTKTQISQYNALVTAYNQCIGD